MKNISRIVLAVLAIGIFQLGIQAKSGYRVNAGGKTGDVVITG
jgi:hypothetical protein